MRDLARLHRQLVALRLRVAEVTRREIHGPNGKIIGNVGEDGVMHLYSGGHEIPRYPHAALHTTAEIQQWCQTHIPHIHWSLQGADPAALQRVIPTLLALGHHYPEPFAQLDRVEVKDFGGASANPDTFARAGGGHGLELNVRIFNNAARLESALQASRRQGFSVTGTIEGLVAHEFGHSVERWMFFTGYYSGRKDFATPDAKGFGNISKTLTLWQRAHRGPVEGLSEYAKTNKEEAFAEGFAALHEGGEKVRAHPYVRQLSALLHAVFDHESPADLATLRQDMGLKSK